MCRMMFKQFNYSFLSLFSLIWGFEGRSSADRHDGLVLGWTEFTLSDGDEADSEVKA